MHGRGALGPAGRTVDPDPAWVDPASDRYQRFLELSA